MKFLKFFIKSWDKQATAICLMCLAGGLWLFFNNSMVSGNMLFLAYFVLIAPTGIMLGRYDLYSKFV